MTAHRRQPALNTLNSTRLPAPGGHYSHLCLAAGLAYISGQLPIDLEGRPMTGQDFDAQARQVLMNLEACLHSAGLTPQDLVQVRVYLARIEDWPRFNEHYAGWLGAHRPARAIVGGAALHFGLDIEIEAVAATR